MTNVFRPWGKTPRLFKDMVITEKIDGTNACVVIVYDPPPAILNPNRVTIVGDFIVYAQSRKRLITPENDNYAFASWVKANAAGLVETLGEGYHYGEWWGWKINRGYGLPEGDRRFSLFNVNRYGELDLSSVPGLRVVPVLSEEPFDTEVVQWVYDELMEVGSRAAPGFYNPEGIIVFHTASQQVYKVTDNGDRPKWAINALREAA